jgi:YidC/Oxa1 family membrane protein insertase
MDRRLLLAIALIVVVAVLPSILWPPKRPATPPAGRPESTAVGQLPPGTSVPESASVAAPRATRPPAPPAPEPATATLPLPAADTTTGRTVIVEGDVFRYAFSTRGARPTSVALLRYRTFAKGDSGPAEILPRDTQFMAYRFIVADDTLALDDWAFQPDTDTLRVTQPGTALHWVARHDGREVRITYTFSPGTYRFEVDGQVVGANEGLLLVDLGPGLRSVDADSITDFRSFGVVTKARRPERLNFRSLSPGERRDLVGPFEWVAIKSKYFLAAVLTLGEGEPRFGGAVAVGGPKPGRYQTNVDVTVSLPSPDGTFRHAVYVGPQEYRRLARIGHDLNDVNPYGWILRPIIRPVVDYAILPILFWMHEKLSLAYGWVLILFGILVRVLLWPLNQKAMRSSTAMQVIQPELKAIQDKHKNDPQKLQQEMLKLYREHGVNPLGGCLPMLLPMPVLFALFFVFANTIEFRGVSFLWLPDLARADPFYIIPIVMGASMFALSWIGQRGLPPNPQAKMMMYLMPGMFTFLFLKFSSGLNLYYAVSNLTSLPQQWLISKERAKRLGARRQQ